MDVIQSTYLTVWGVFFFIICHSLVISLRASRAFIAVERMSRKLTRQNIELSRLDRLKDEFLANTSHELRTPLAGIVGISEALLAGAGGKLSDPASSNLSMIVRSGRRLSNLVNDMLDFSRLKHKDIELSLGPVHPARAVDMVLAMSKELLRGKRTELRQDILEGIPCVRADEVRLQQILFNLVGNAVKFTEEGSVTVYAGEDRAGPEAHAAEAFRHAPCYKRCNDSRKRKPGDQLLQQII